MKNFKKIVLSLVLFICFFSISDLNAATGTYSQNMSVSRRGSSVSQVISTPPFGIEKQVYSVNVSGTYEGHGAIGPSGGKYGISVCINNGGGMWSGSCWNIVDANGAGNIGDARGSIPNTTVDIGNTSNDFNYVSANVYVNDADANVTLEMYGREVSINGFNTTSSSVGVGGQFDITWDASERTADSVITYSGPVSCDVGSGSPVAGNSGGTTCTGSSAGTATFSLQATGYGGYGTKSVTSQPISVNIIQPPVSCGNNTVEAGEQCDAGVNNGSCPRTCSNACTVNTCSANLCGNGVVNAGEQCDSGVNNGVLPRTCSNLCTVNTPPNPTLSTFDFTVSGPGNVGVRLNRKDGNGVVTIGDVGPGRYIVSLVKTWDIYLDAKIIPGDSNDWTWNGLCSFFNSPQSAVCFGTASADIVTGINFLPVPVTGTLTPVNSTCTIPAGQSSCYSPTLTWSTSGFTNGVVSTVTSSTGVPASVTGNSGSSAFLITHNPADPANEFYLRNNGATLATAVVTTSCVAGTVWSGGVCTTITTPTVDSVLLNSGSVMPDGSTQYTVTIRGSDTGGGNKITYQYSLLRDSTGANKGILAWHPGTVLSPDKNYRGCTGGGNAAILSTGGWAGYGDQYIRLISCNTSWSGNSRTTNFVMVFEPTYTTTLTNNDIWGIVYNTNNNNSPWVNFDQNFSLYMPPPTNLSVTCPAPGTTLNASWTSPGAYYNTFYYRASTPSTDWTGNVEQSTVTGTSRSRASVAGQTYNVWVHTRHPSDPNFYSSLVSQTVTCSLPGAPVVTLTASPNPVASGNSTTLTWTVSAATSCTSIGANAIPAGNWSTAGNGNVSSGAIASARTYRLSCTGPGGTTLSSPVTVNVTATPTLSLSPLTGNVAGAGSLRADFTNIPTPNSLDWIAIYPVGSPDQPTPTTLPPLYTDWVWASDCTRTQPTTAAQARANGNCANLFMPASAGAYELRIFSSNSWTRILTSNSVNVQAPVGNVALTVTANPGPGGRVSTADSLINCGSDCSENYPSGSNVTLTATPASSYWKFNGWTTVPANRCVVSGNNCTINNLTAPVTANASFIPRSFIYKEF